MAKYSVVFHPSETVIEAVKELKEQLSAKIGWFPSKNSLAHVTICEFDCELTTYENIKSRIANYCSYQNPFEVTFNTFGNYSNGAFFIAVFSTVNLLIINFSNSSCSRLFLGS